MATPDGDEEGFGFVFGERGGTLFIATANHVVRKQDEPAARVSVRFRDDLGHAYAARLSDLQVSPPLGDLAILEMPRLPGFRPHWLPSIPMRDIRDYSHAWRIGRKMQWAPASVPGVLTGKPYGLSLEYQNLDTPSGSSGGPVVDETGVVGMVMSDGGMGGGGQDVMPIDRIELLATNWHLPWQLSAPEPPRASELAGAVVAGPAIQASMPAPVSPQRNALPPLGVTEMEAAARRLTADLFATLSAGDGVALAFNERSYAPTVFFNGQSVSHAALMSMEQAEPSRWPQRRFVPRWRTMNPPSCQASTAACRLDVTVDWWVGRAAGTATYTLSIGFKDRQAAILAQTASGAPH